MAAVDYKSVDFEAEINKLFASREFDIEAADTPLEFVKKAILKAVCGWSNGNSGDAILAELVYVRIQRGQADQITDKGQAFLWWAFGSYGIGDAVEVELREGEFEKLSGAGRVGRSMPT